MNPNDFRYMRQGKQIAHLKTEDLAYLKPIERRGTGTKKALLLIHGFGSSPAVYRYLIPQITAYDAIFCPVLPGHADSIHSFSETTALAWREAVQENCACLVKEYQEVDVLGLSLGGLLAYELSALFPLHHLFLLAPALKLHLQLNRMIPLAKTLQKIGFRFLRSAAGNLISEEHAEIAYRTLPVTTIIEMLTLAKNYKEISPNCPVDVFLGRHDEVVDSEAVELMLSPLPQTTIHWLNNSAHVLPLDNDIDQILTCINKEHIS